MSSRRGEGRRCVSVREAPGMRAPLTRLSVLIAIALVAAACTNDRKPNAGGATTTTAAPAAVPFGEHDLPSPVSVLEATADRVVYFAVGADNTLEHVAVDVERRRVAWRAPASRSFSPTGTGVGNKVIDEIAFRWESVPGAESALALHAVRARDGSTLWRTILEDAPHLLPFACGEDLCVPESRGTPVRDRRTGETKERVGSQGRVIGGADDLSRSLAIETIGVSEPAGAITGFTRQGRDVAWTSTRAELFADASVTADAGWIVDSGEEPADGWVVWLGGTFVVQADGTRVEDVIPPGAIASISSDGRRRWTLPGWPCFSLESASTRCDGETRVLPAGGVSRTVTRMELLSPTTGDTLGVIQLTVPIDDAKPGSRVVRQKEGRLLVDTGGRTFVTVDVRAGTVQPAATGDVLGWCEPAPRSVTLPTPNGEDVKNVSVRLSREPCSSDGGPVAPERVADAIRRGVMDDDEQFVAAGRWRFWIEGDRLRGVDTGS